MENKNNNKASWQQLKPEERKQLIADYRKIIATADKITDDYNDDPDVCPNHVLLAIGVFLRRMEYSFTDEKAETKDGHPWGKQIPGQTEAPTYATMLTVIQKGYEIEGIREAGIPEELKKTLEDDGE